MLIFFIIKYFFQKCIRLALNKKFARSYISDPAISEKHKKVRRALNYCEHFPFFVSAIRGCVSISCFASLVGVPVGIKSSAVLLKVCV